jgi:hypothetical protein
MILSARHVKDYGERSFESEGLKQALKDLGWEEQILDYRTLELIFLFLEDEKRFEINRIASP